MNVSFTPANPGDDGLKLGVIRTNGDATVDQIAEARSHIHRMNTSAARGVVFEQYGQFTLSDGSELYVRITDGQVFAELTPPEVVIEVSELEHGTIVSSATVETPKFIAKDSAGENEIEKDCTRYGTNPVIQYNHQIKEVTDGVDPPSILIPLVITTLAGKYYLTIFGDPLPVPDLLVGLEEWRDKAIPVIVSHKEGWREVQARYVTKKGVFDNDGEQILAIPDVPREHPGYTAGVVRYDPMVDAEARSFYFTQSRLQLTSPTFDLWRLRFWWAKYAGASGAPTLSDTKTTDMRLPMFTTNAGTTTGGAGSFNKPDKSVRVTQVYGLPGGSGSGYNATGQFNDPPVLWVNFPWRATVVTAVAVSDQGGWSKRTGTDAAPTNTAGFIPYAGPDASVPSGTLSVLIDAPETSDIRAGATTAAIDYTGAPTTESGGGVSSKSITERKFKTSVPGKIDVHILMNTEFSILKGKTSTSWDGERSESATVYVNSYNTGDFRPSLGTTTRYVIEGTEANVVDFPSWRAWAIAGGYKFDELAEQVGTPRTVVVEEPTKSITGTANYEYTSTWHLDVDTRVGLSVALCVRVTCAQAKWKKGPDYEGQVIVDTIPQYTVDVYLMAGDEKVDISRDVFSRPAHEFIRVLEANVFRWPAPESFFAQFWIYYAPIVAPNKDAMMQLANMIKTQSFHDYYAGPDINPLPSQPIRDEQKESETGVEASSTVAGVDIPHIQYPTPDGASGYTYFRLITPVEFDDAFWLLRALKMDRGLNNEEDSSYAYLPNFNDKKGKVIRVSISDIWGHDWHGAVAPGTEDPGIKLSFV